MGLDQSTLSRTLRTGVDRDLPGEGGMACRQAVRLASSRRAPFSVSDCFSIQEANWRIPTVMFAGLLGMASGGWGAGLLYDRFGDYLPAFSSGMAFNLVNLCVLLFLNARPHTRLMRQPQTST